jgi:hypothetical protein
VGGLGAFIRSDCRDDGLDLNEKETSAVGWKDLLQTGDEKVTLPWLGGRTLYSAAQRWSIEGRLPKEYGWHTFTVANREARVGGPASAQPDLLQHAVRGYLVGDRLVADDIHIDPDPKRITEFSEKVFLLDEGLDRFARVCAGRVNKEGPLVYQGLEMPLGQEDQVLEAFLDQKTSVAPIKGVSPALDAAFRMESWQRLEAERRRVELKRLRREEDEKRQKEERRKELVKKLGDGEGRREMALHDFDAAARAALAVGGAVFLDAKKLRHNEWAVRYRLDRQKFECVCNERLRIIDAGICLVDHDTNEKGDTFFTLESLPAVVQQAQRERRLVIFRHV